MKKYDWNSIEIYVILPLNLYFHQTKLMKFFDIHESIFWKKIDLRRTDCIEPKYIQENQNPYQIIEIVYQKTRDIFWRQNLLKCYYRE